MKQRLSDKLWRLEQDSLAEEAVGLEAEVENLRAAIHLALAKWPAEAHLGISYYALADTLEPRGERREGDE